MHIHAKALEVCHIHIKANFMKMFPKQAAMLGGFPSWQIQLLCATTLSLICVPSCKAPLCCKTLLGPKLLPTAAISLWARDWVQESGSHGAAFWTLVRPYLEYCAQFSLPRCGGLGKDAEVYQNYTWSRDISQRERLERFELFSLEPQRLWGTLREVYKMIRSIDEVPFF